MSGYSTRSLMHYSILGVGNHYKDGILRIKPAVEGLCRQLDLGTVDLGGETYENPGWVFICLSKPPWPYTLSERPWLTIFVLIYGTSFFGTIFYMCLWVFGAERVFWGCFKFLRMHILQFMNLCLLWLESWKVDLLQERLSFFWRLLEDLRVNVLPKLLSYLGRAWIVWCGLNVSFLVLCPGV